MRNGLVNLGSLFQMLFMELSTFMLQSREQIKQSLSTCTEPSQRPEKLAMATSKAAV